jgi:hypothetical protein
MKETKPMLYLKYQEVPAPSALGRWRETENKRHNDKSIDLMSHTMPADLTTLLHSHAVPE